MKTKIFLLWAILVFAFTVSSCENDTVKPEPLAGTKWELVGFYDTEKNEIIDVELEDCLRYILDFLTDHTAKGKEVDMCDDEIGVINYFELNLFDNPIFHPYIPVLGIFWNAARTVTSYELKDNLLKFYYNDRKNYLLFEKVIK
jgi:hypothetical protein